VKYFIRINSTIVESSIGDKNLLSGLIIQNVPLSSIFNAINLFDIPKKSQESDLNKNPVKNKEGVRNKKLILIPI
jgi:hypothetical protein